MKSAQKFGFVIKTLVFLRRTEISGCALLIAGIFFCPNSIAAQEHRLSSNLSESGVVLRDSPQPLRFFDATGRKAAVFGRQDGQFEAWIYAIKLLHNFRLEFQQEGQLEPIRGETLLRQVITRPESTTLVYVHPNFSVREIIWTPFNEPAVVIYFDVDSSKPLDITAAFVPDFKPMWPASFGGQHSSWIANEKALALTDATEGPTALVGSPGVSTYSEVTDHQLAAGEILLRMRSKPGESRSILPPLVMALNMESEAKASAVYHDVLARSAELFQQRVEHDRQFLDRTLSFESPNPELNQDFLWAKVTLDSGWVCHPRYGCGLIAGYGPSGVGERPGFDWWFGGDAMMSSWALEDAGDLDGALQALRFLKARQRADGKIMHEMTQSVDLLDWFGKFHYAYYHADSTPMYLYSLGQYWRRTGDAKFLNEFWESAKQAYSYCLSTVTPEDGLMDNTKAGLAAVEVGVLRGKVVKDIYLEGFWVGALEAMAPMSAAKEEKSLAQDATQRAAKARESLQKNWWSPEQHAFTFGITADGHRTDLIGVWPGVLLALSDQLDSQQAASAAAIFAKPNLATDWGVRWLSDQNPLYDPLSYNNGTAWPFMSGFAAWSQYKHGLPLSGFSNWSSVAQLTGLSSPGAVPELMNGDRYLPGEFAVPHQLFSSDGVILPAVRGVLGLETQGPSSESDGALQVSFSPNLPADWPFLRFQRYAIGDGRLSGEVLQQRSQTTLQLTYDGKTPVIASVSPSLPAAARVKNVRLDGKPVKFSVREFGSFIRVEIAPVTLRASQQSTLAVAYDGGIGIVPPMPHPQPGQRTSSLKILDAQSNTQNPKCLVQLTLAGRGGRTYPLQIISTLPNLQAGGLILEKTETGYTLQIPFMSSNSNSDYISRQVCLAN
ncbi:MAG TPA: GH116 family glycosyl hydrolase [Candidatus Acidoferrum sp.]|nr:GH116 family glycosyl hydrolase [Candidatus Acidoferrum sp.]